MLTHWHEVRIYIKRRGLCPEVVCKDGLYPDVVMPGGGFVRKVFVRKGFCPEGLFGRGFVQGVYVRGFIPRELCPGFALCICFQTLLLR